jgi:aminoglycoside 3-N-acetyltransferase
MVTTEDLRRAIRNLGLSGLPVCAHSSLSSFGHLDGGADDVIDAFLDEGCTLLVPAFSSAFLVAPPEGMRPARNGWDYEGPRPQGDDSRIYARETTEISPGLGIVPRTLVRRPRRERGYHPLNSFAAVGPDAAELVGSQRPLDVYAPLRLLSDRGGFVLLVGVGLTRMTLLHLAEAQAGRELFRRWARGPNGEVIDAQTGSCSNGFDALEPVLRPLARETYVGESRWRAYPVRETLRTAAEAILADPQITHCGDAACLRCRDAVAGGPLL